MKIFLIFSVCIIVLITCKDLPPEVHEVHLEEGVKDINGTKLFYKVEGQGEPVFVVHGGPGLNHKYLLPHLQPLSDKFRLIFYDQRACGQSSPDLDTTSITLDNFILDIEGLRTAFDFEKINLMAHSWGGILAMRYASKYPDKVKSLILVNSVGASSEIRNKANQLLAQRFTKYDSLERIKILSSKGFQDRNAEAIESLMKIGFKHQFYNPQYIERLELFLNENYPETSRLLQYLGKDLSEYDFHEELKNIRSPTLLIYGTDDPLTRLAGNKILESILNSRMKVIKECGHFPFIEKQDEFNQTVVSFINENE